MEGRVVCRRGLSGGWDGGKRPGAREPTAVRVRGSSIVTVGEPDAVAGAGDEIVDLDGGTLLPGFIDAHVHPVMGGVQLRQCDLRGARDSAANYQRVIADYAAAHPAAEWITGSGWTLSAFPGGIPTRELLDEVVPDRPDLALAGDALAGGAAVGQDVRRALAALPRRQRTAVVLRFFLDLSEADTADAMGCSIGTVKSTTHKALAALRTSPLLADLVEGR